MAFGLGVRLMTFWQSRHRGCDAYYFLLSSDEFRKRRRIPIVLPPVYLLEEPGQWYPPGFSVFLALIPRQWLTKFYWIVSPVVDCVVVGVTYGVVIAVTGEMWLAVLAGVLHAINSASVSDCTNLNSRLLGALLFTGTVLGMAGTFVGLPLAWLALLCGAGLLLTHKLSSQLLYVLLPAMSLLLWDVGFLVGLVAILAFTVVASRKFMLKVWRAQGDILGFWRTNWKDLGAHQIDDSPMYSKVGESDQQFLGSRMFLGGWVGLFKQIQHMGMNPMVIMVLIPAVYFAELSKWDLAMFWWAVVTYVFAAATIFVKPLRFIGEGHRYLKLAALPVSYLAILPLWRGWDVMGWYWPMLVLAVGMAVYALWRMCRFMGDPSKTLVPFVDDDLSKVIEFLKVEQTENILCVPDSLADALGYYCQKGVLRGTHNYPFRDVQAFFPYHRLPLDYLVRWYGSSHVVVSTGYVDPSRLEFPEGMTPVLEAGNYTVYAEGGVG